jgi:translation initiation factor IF-1
MPKNIGGGARYKKRKTKGEEGPGAVEYPDEEQEFGVIVRKYGNGLMDLMISKGPKDTPSRALGKVRGALKKRRVRFEEGSLLIVSRRDFEHSDRVLGEDGGRPMVDILHCYHPDHRRYLINDRVVHPSFKQYSNKLAGGEDEKDDGDDDSDDGFTGGYKFDNRTAEEIRDSAAAIEEDKRNIKTMIDDL